MLRGRVFLSYHSYIHLGPEHGKVVSLLESLGLRAVGQGQRPWLASATASFRRESEQMITTKICELPERYATVDGQRWVSMLYPSVD